MAYPPTPRVLTLIAPAGTILDDSIIRLVTETAMAAGARAAEPKWLSPGEAVDLKLAQGGGDGLDRMLRTALAPRRIDFALLPATGRRKLVLVADLESTVIRNEMLDDLAATAGIGAKVAAITLRAMSGELDFGESLRERVALLAGLPEARLTEVASGIEIMSGARALVATMKAHGAYTAIVSGGFKIYTSRVRELLGFDEDQGNELEIAASALTGRLREPIVNRDGKLDALLRIARARGVGAADVLAVGDGANDLPMLLAAGLGVAFHAKPAVAAALKMRVEYADLTALLFFQGYRRAEFVE